MYVNVPDGEGDLIPHMGIVFATAPECGELCYTSTCPTLALVQVTCSIIFHRYAALVKGAHVPAKVSGSL